MALEEEFHDLLKQHGLELPIDERSVADRLEEVKRLAESSPDAATRRRAKETVAMLGAIDEATDGAVSHRLSETGDAATSQYLRDYYRVVQEGMSHLGIPIPRNVYFNVFPTGEFNAVAHPSKSGILCLLNTGLLRLLSNISYVSCYPIRVSGNEILYDEEAEARDGVSAIDVAHTGSIRVIVNYLRAENHDYPMPANRELAPWGTIYANSLARAMKVFALAHEMGHVVLGHCDATPVRTIRTAVGQLGVVGNSHQDELDADAWAQRVLFAMDEAEAPRFPLAVGGIGFLTVHLMVLHVYARLAGVAVEEVASSESHPDSAFRISRLRESIEQQSNQHDRVEALTLWALLARVLELIKRSEITADEEELVIKVSDPSEQRVLRLRGGSLV